MKSDRNRVCPVEWAGSLDNRIRRWLHNPQKILVPYVSAGMTALDIGCGPGFFALEMARLVGPAGRVIAADLQDGMLQKLRQKARGTELESRIVLHQCRSDRLDVSDKVDFVLAFYMVHEVPDPARLFREIAAFLRPGGKVLIVEPPFHVSKADFTRTLETAREAGLEVSCHPRILFGRTALLQQHIP